MDRGIIKEILSDLEIYGSEIKSNNPKSLLKQIDYDGDSSTYQGMMELRSSVKDILKPAWDNLSLMSMINDLYELRWTLIDVISDDNLLNLKQARQIILDAMNADLLSQFQEVKFDEKTSSEEYPNLVTQYYKLLDDYLSIMNNMITGIKDKVTPLLGESQIFKK